MDVRSEQGGCQFKEQMHRGRRWRAVLTGDVGQSEPFPRQALIRMEVYPDVVLGGDVGRWQ